MQNQKSAVSIFSSVTHAISFSESGLTEGENLHQTVQEDFPKEPLFLTRVLKKQNSADEAW